ncbi:MAG: hypothetical protein FJ299_09820 [Planctomycetes bacterium]|nr:hypothetical protein [Planctomycetota bacterium]
MKAHRLRLHEWMIAVCVFALLLAAALQRGSLSRDLHPQLVAEAAGRPADGGADRSDTPAP